MDFQQAARPSRSHRAPSAKSTSVRSVPETAGAHCPSQMLIPGSDSRIMPQLLPRVRFTLTLPSSSIHAASDQNTVANLFVTAMATCGVPQHSRGVQLDIGGGCIILWTGVMGGGAICVGRILNAYCPAPSAMQVADRTAVFQIQQARVCHDIVSSSSSRMCVRSGRHSLTGKSGQRHLCSRRNPQTCHGRR